MDRQEPARFQVRFWGVRGSYPVSNPNKLKFGGHTSCVELEADGHRLIFDAGTGIIPLGKRLLEDQKSPLRLCIFLSHTHHDHIIGLYFFEPLLKATTSLAILGPNSAERSLRTTLQAAMDSQFFPIGFKDLKAEKKIYSLNGGQTIRIRPGNWIPKIEKQEYSDQTPFEAVAIRTHKSSAHPRNGVLLYRICYRNKALVYATDIEEKKGGYRDVIDFARGADLLIHDAQYSTSEYLSRTESRRGWGHSTVEGAAEVAKKAAVRRLVLFHHEPTREDKEVFRLENRARRIFPASVAAYEGLEFDLLKGA